MVFVPMLLLDKDLNDTMQSLPTFVGVYIALYLFMKYVANIKE